MEKLPYSQLVSCFVKMLVAKMFTANVLTVKIPDMEVRDGGDDKDGGDGGGGGVVGMVRRPDGPTFFAS